MLLEQFDHLKRRWDSVLKRRRHTPTADLGADGQAILEAVLVHLRLLDAFLDTPPRGDDVAARHWVKGWKTRKRNQRVFTPKMNDRVNAQVAHLAARRRMPGVRPQELGEPVLRCCKRLREFFEAVERRNDARAEAIAKPRRLVDEFLAQHGQ
jgi:hypothetical protein